MCFSELKINCKKGGTTTYSKKILLMCAGVILLFSAAGLAQSRTDSLKQEAIRWVHANGKMFDDASLAIWRFAEIALAEYKSSKLLADMLEREGFTVERAVADMPTAFVASFGSGRPAVGILAEYDALPGLSQKLYTARKEALEPGAPGHGCGHNLFGVGSTAAAMAIKSVMQKHRLAGTVKLFGCPAEETLLGKVYMAKEGIFDGLDVCFAWHPGSRNAVRLDTSSAMNNFEITFHGKTAHGAASPWSGRSALDAVELTNIGVNFFREHVRPTVRMHYVIPDGGMAPNVVPDYAKVWYFVRDEDREGVEHLYDRVLKIAEGAASMTETTHEVYLITGVYNKMMNRVLAKILYQNLQLVGAPQFTEDEQKFAKQLQSSFGAKEVGLNTKIEELKEPERFMGGGSTDVGDVSWLVPTASLNTVCWPSGAPGHSWGAVTCTGSSIGFKGMRVTAKTIATSAIEVLMDPRIVEKAQAELKEKTKDFTYKSAVPKYQKPRLPINKK
jgi:aminobenzoyl-glutamate utilization protein B